MSADADIVRAGVRSLPGGKAEAAALAALARLEAAAERRGVMTSEEWERMAPEEQDRLIASGWHPGPEPLRVHPMMTGPICAWCHMRPKECVAQRDALAEAQAKALAAIDAEIAKMHSFYEDCKEEGSYSEAATYGRKIDGLKFARAALAEAGLE